MVRQAVSGPWACFGLQWSVAGAPLRRGIFPASQNPVWWGLGLAGQQVVVVDEEYLAGALGPLAAIPPRNGLPPNTPVLKCKSWKMHVSGAHLPTKTLQYQVHA